MSEIVQRARKYIVFLCLVVSDIAAIFTSIFAAFALRAYVLPYIFTSYFLWQVDFREFTSRWYGLFIWIIVFGYEKLYTKRYSVWEETRILVKANSIAYGLIAVSFFSFQDYLPFSRLIFALAWLFGLALLPVFRFVTKRVLILLGLWTKRVVVIGSSDATASVIDAVRNDRTMGYQIVGCLTDDRTKVGGSIAGAPILAHFDEIEDLQKRTAFEDIIVTFPNLPHDRLISLLKRWDGVAETIRYIPQTGDLITTGIEIENIGRLLSLVVRKNLHKPWNILLKSAFEFVLALVFLILLLPFFVVIALAIRIDSRGPAFFIQERFGRRGRTIEIIKFRTMYRDAERRLREHLRDHPEAREEWETFKKLKASDPRVTRIGRFLRRHSLDELPQLSNVLKFEMAIVGPRPYLQEELQEMRQVKSLLFQVKPGITGLWQISGRSNIPFTERLKLDEHYIRNWSLWMDIVILFKTLKVTLFGQGAY